MSLNVSLNVSLHAIPVSANRSQVCKCVKRGLMRVKRGLKCVDKGLKCVDKGLMRVKRGLKCVDEA